MRPRHEASENAAVSVITQFDALLIEFDDGLEAMTSVIGGGMAADGDITIKIGDGHRDRDRQRPRRRQR